MTRARRGRMGRWIETTRRAWTVVVVAVMFTMTLETSWAMETTKDATTTTTTTGGRTATTGGRTMTTTNYFSTLDERELFDTLRERTVVLGLFVPHCELCATYADEFRYAAELFAKKDAETSVDASSSVVFVEIPDARETPNATAALNATNAPFVTILKKNRWYYVTPSGETKIRTPNRYKGALNVKETVEWLNYALGRRVGERVVVPPVVDEVTGDDVDAYVRDETHDVLIEFYAKWCGHCKAFERDYEQVGAHFAKERRLTGRPVKVGRIDVDTARDAAARYEITGLPTVQLFPRAYKRRGIAYKGAKKTTQRVIDFVNSPDVALAEMKIKDMERWRCFEWLRDEGALETHAHVERALSGEKLSPEALDQVVHHVFDAAQERARRELWHDAMITLMCMASTSELKNTPTGNSAAVWNLLDNAKFHVENRRASGDGDTDEHGDGDGDRDVTENAADEPVDWEAVRREQAELWRRERAERRLHRDADDVFADEEWFDFDDTDPVDVPDDADARARRRHEHGDEL